jgi:hypothetical protein
MKPYIPTVSACIFALVMAFLSAGAQDLDNDRKIIFPDIPGYRTLKADLHQHTVFSDGNVWPTIRIQEALRDGLDFVAMTDHIEYQPHLDDIPHPDRNRSYQIALDAAKDNDMLVVNGSEITRSMPPGHANAIFLKDANALLVSDPVEAFREAGRQGAFIFWNHPHWTSQRSDGIARLDPMHRQLIDEGLLHGIEVVNDVTYSDEALQIALDHNLTIMGTSDIHGLIDWQYEVPSGGHRPVTLIFAREKSAPSVKEALMQRRTAVWFNNTLIGREEHLTPLVQACLSIEKAVYQKDKTVLQITIQNHSDAEFLLDNQSSYTFHANADVVRIAPNGETVLLVKTIDRKEKIRLPFEVLNGIIAPNTHPDIVLEATVEE